MSEHATGPRTPPSFEHSLGRLQEIVVYGGAEPCSTHATIMPRQLYVAPQRLVDCTCPPHPSAPSVVSAAAHR